MDRKLMLATLVGTTLIAPLASAQSAPSSGQCNDTPYIPITGQIGPDGAWHPSRAPHSPPPPPRVPCPPPQAAPQAPVTGDSAANAPANGSGNAGATGTGGGPATSSASAATTAATTPEATSTTQTVDSATAPPATGGAVTTTTAATAPVTPRGWTPVTVRPAPVVTHPATTTTTTSRGGGPWYAQPYVQYGGTAYIVPTRRPVVIAAQRPRHVRRVYLVLGGAVGGGNFIGEAATSTQPGWVWSGSLGVSFYDVVSLEARYDGGWIRYRSELPFSADSGVLATGGTGLLRLTLPIPVVQPYVQAGVGVYHFDLQGSGAPDTLANTTQHTVGQVPFGGGIEFRLHRRFGLTGEFMYRWLFDNTGFEGPSQTWGNVWTATGGVRFYL